MPSQPSWGLEHPDSRQAPNHEIKQSNKPAKRGSPGPMPPRTRAALSKKPLQLADSFFFCPSCSRVRLPPSTSRRQISSSQQRRPSATTPTPTFASSSAVNVTRNIPERFAELYKALKSVGDGASNHVNVSRLQLALRGLETESPVIRVAGMFSDAIELDMGASNGNT